MRELSAELKAAAFAQETGEVFVVLLAIDHPSIIDGPLRLVADGQDLTSRGHVYTAYPFELTLPDDKPDSAPRARLQIDNVSREIGLTIRSLRTPPQVTIELVRTAEPDTVEIAFPPLTLRNVKYNAATVQGDLEFDILTREPFPADTFTPTLFPGLF